jgi:hypothetical protein
MRLSGRGYTIFEVMLFLAITGALFVSTYALMQGQQKRTQFTQGMRDIESKFRDYINDVSTGYFPEVGSFNCAVNSGNIEFTASGGGDTTGTNLDCIFLGKAIQAQSRPALETDVLYAYTVVGKRRIPAGAATRDTNNYTQAEADPTVVEDSLIGLDKTESYELPWGVRLAAVSMPDNNSSMLGIYGTLSQALTSLPGNNESGAQQLRPILYSLPINGSQADAIARVNNTESNANLAAPFDGWSLCFRRDDGQEEAEISIGGGANATNVTLTYKDCTP